MFSIIKLYSELSSISHRENDSNISHHKFYRNLGTEAMRIDKSGDNEIIYCDGLFLQLT